MLDQIEEIKRDVTHFILNINDFKLNNNWDL